MEDIKRDMRKQLHIKRRVSKVYQPIEDSLESVECKEDNLEKK